MSEVSLDEYRDLLGFAACGPPVSRGDVFTDTDTDAPLGVGRYVEFVKEFPAQAKTGLAAVRFRFAVVKTDAALGLAPLVLRCEVITQYEDRGDTSTFVMYELRETEDGQVLCETTGETDRWRLQGILHWVHKQPGWLDFKTWGQQSDQ